jgi:hypothetical protein
MDEREKVVLIDLEGTITDHSHRLHYYYKKDYESYNSFLHLDPVNSAFVEYLLSDIEQIKPDKIILATAKSIDLRSDTMNWLHSNYATSTETFYDLFDEFIFREHLDSRSSVLVKRDFVKGLIDDKDYNIVAAYDDRRDICEMYEEFGIKSVLVSNVVKTPANLLNDMADLFKQRNALYGSSYKTFGSIMVGLFPDGLNLKTAEDFSRFGMLNMMVSKMDRYTSNFSKGGHPDSLRDLSVYSAMLLETDNEL